MLSRRSAKQAGGLAVSDGVALLLALLQAVVAARVLGADGYGVALTIISVPTLLGAIAATRAGASTVVHVTRMADTRGPRASAAVRASLLADTLSASLALVVLGGLLLIDIDRRSGVAGNADLMVAYGLALVAGASRGATRAALMAMGRFRQVARLQVVIAVLRVGTVLVVLLAGGGASGFVLASAAGVLAEALVYWFPAVGHLKERTGHGPLGVRVADLGKDRRGVWALIRATTLESTLDVLSKQGQEVVLALVVGPTSVGIYRIATRVQTVVGTAVGAVLSVLLPRLRRAVDDPALLRSLVRRYLRSFGGPLAVAVLAGTLVMPLAVPLVFGEDFEGSVIPAQVLLLGSSIYALTGWLRMMLLATEQGARLVRIKGVTAVGMVVGTLVGAVTGGALGVAVVRAGVPSAVNGVVALRVDRELRSSALSPGDRR